MNKVFAALVLAVGVMLVILGLQVSDLVSSEMSELYANHPVDHSIWIMLGGAFAFVAGIGMLACSPRQT